MTSTDHPWRSPALSTSTDAAVRCYRQGIAALIAGAPHAERNLEDAVAADPEFVLARIGLAAARFALGRPFALQSDGNGGTTRAERHHAEIVEAVCHGDRHRATDLRREHLLEYPADLLIVWAPALDPGRTR
jgi:DNA-binding GntR family transcriptional regulator